MDCAEKSFYTDSFKAKLWANYLFRGGLWEKDIMCYKPVFFFLHTCYSWCLVKVTFLRNFVMKIIPHTKIFHYIGCTVRKHREPCIIISCNSSAWFIHITPFIYIFEIHNNVFVFRITALLYSKCSLLGQNTILLCSVVWQLTVALKLLFIRNVLHQGVRNNFAIKEVLWGKQGGNSG